MALALQILFTLGNFVALVGGPWLAAQVNSWWGFWPWLFCFASFAFGLLGWGARLSRYAGERSAGAFLFSSLVAVVFAFAVGHLALLGPTHRWLFTSFLVVGVWLWPAGSAKDVFVFFRNPWLNVVLSYVLLVRFLAAFLPEQHGDPLLYHLMAPRIWNLQGVVRLNTDNPVPYLASTWEYFYLWAQVLWTNRPAPVTELVGAQIFSQWTHLFWGFLGALVVMRELLLRARPRLDEISQLILCLTMLFVESLHWTAGLAKNDCGIAFWCLGAWLFLSRTQGEGRPRSNWALGGIFAGLAVAGKINAILFLIPVALVRLVRMARDVRKGVLPLREALVRVGAGVAGSVAAAGPLYFRNWWETTDPFYPTLTHWFPTPWVSQSWADHFSVHQPTVTNPLKMFAYRLAQLRHESPAFWLLLLLPVALYWRPSRERLLSLREDFAIFLLAIVLIVFAVAPDAEVRYLGASLWLGAVLGAFTGIALLELLPAAVARGGKILFLALILALSHLPSHLLWRFSKVQTGEAAVLHHTAGAAKDWVRRNIGQGRLLLLSGDNETYYLSNLRLAVVTERPDIDAATYHKTDLHEFVRGLCTTSGAGTLIDVRDGLSLKRRFPDGPWDEAVLFEADGSRVYDLVKIQSRVLGENVGCGRE